MSTSLPELAAATVGSVEITEDTISFDLSDGRTIVAPMAWFPRLMDGTAAERRNWRFIGQGHGVHWPDLDEDVSVEGLLLGRPSGESQASLRRWLEERKRIRRTRGAAKRPRKHD